MQSSFSCPLIKMGKTNEHDIQVNLISVNPHYQENTARKLSARQNVPVSTVRATNKG